MRAMKLPFLRQRRYTNKAGDTWVGYYYQPPTGSEGAPGVRPKPIALGSHMVKGKGPHTPPASVLVEYGKMAGKAMELPGHAGAIGSVYEAWHTWARAEVAADRLARRTLQDYTDLWATLQPVFSAGQINALTQPVLLAYFDKRTSKDRAKREIAFLGLLCSWAKARGQMTATNPVDRGLRHQMKVPKRKAPVVSSDAYWVVWQCADQLVRDTLDLSFMAATRPSEALRIPMPAQGWTEMEVYMSKTRSSGRPVKLVPRTPELANLVERRRALHPHSLLVLFDERGQQLRANGAIRSRLYKARDLAKAVCQEAGVPWTDFTRQQLRPTAITQTDKLHGREEARKLAGHTNDKQTAHYVRHEAERVVPVAVPTPDLKLLNQVIAAKQKLGIKLRA